MSTEEATEPQLEPFTTTPTGGRAARCQRVKKGEDQCPNPARTGYQICSSHGAGRGSKRPGRPVTHGTYSVTPTTDVNTLMAETAALEDVLESSDRDLLVLKATLLYKLGELDRCGPKVDQVDRQLEQLEMTGAELPSDPLSADQALQLAGAFSPMRSTVRDMAHLVSDVSDISARVLNAHKTRAETNAKLAEQRGVSVAVKLCQVARGIVHELARDDANLKDSYELALQRELYGPLRLEVPDVNTPPEAI